MYFMKKELNYLLLALTCILFFGASFATSLDQNLIFHAKLDEGTGTTVANDSNALAGGTIGGSGTTWVTGIDGNAINFNGSGWVDFGDNQSISGKSSLTVSIWVKTTTPVPGQQLPFAKHNGGTDGSFFLSIPQTFQARFTMITTSGRSDWTCTTETQLVDGNWHLFAGVWDNNVDGNNLIIYVDKKKLTTACSYANVAPPLAGTVTTVHQSMYLGRYAANTSLDYNGTIDDARIWARALSPADINTLYNNFYKINPNLSLSFSPSNSVQYGTETTVTGNGCPAGLTCTLTRDGNSVSNPDINTLVVMPVW